MSDEDKFEEDAEMDFDPEDIGRALRKIFSDGDGPMGMPINLGKLLGKKDKKEEEWELHSYMSDAAKVARKIYNTESDKFKKQLDALKEQHAKMESKKRMFWATVESDTGLYNTRMQVDDEAGSISIEKPEPKENKGDKKA